MVGVRVGGIDPGAMGTTTATATNTQFQGAIAAVKGFNRELADEDRRCMYKNDLQWMSTEGL